MALQETLDRTIRDILESPQTNLNKVSMKNVREQLPKMNRSLSESWIRTHMDAVDKRIMEVYEQVNASRDG